MRVDLPRHKGPAFGEPLWPTARPFEYSLGLSRQSQVPDLQSSSGLREVGGSNGYDAVEAAW